MREQLFGEEVALPAGNPSVPLSAQSTQMPDPASDRWVGGVGGHRRDRGDGRRHGGMEGMGEVAWHMIEKLRREREPT